MKMKFALNLLVLLAIAMLLMLEACAPKTTTSTTQTNGKYSEDLSVYRPKIEETVDTVKSNNTNGVDNTGRNPTTYVEAKHAIATQLDAVLDSIDRINHVNGTIDGFTIQLYSGIKREEALAIKKEMTIVLPKMDAEVQYVQPNFRVRAGKYINRIEAQKDYMTIKRHFPSAIVIPDRISIREIRSQR